MKNITIMILVGVVLLFGILKIEGYCGEMGVGLSYMKNGHSEGTEKTKTRCINDGVGIDLGYEFDSLTYDLHKYFMPEVRFGGMLTYTVYETAFRETSTSPESDEKIEHSVTLTGTAKPGFKIGIVHPYAYVGAGPDWMQSNGLDVGYFLGSGIDIDVTDDVMMGFNYRKFHRSDGSTYKYLTLQAVFTF